MPTAEQTKAIQRYVSEVWEQGKLDVIDEIFTPDRVRHGPDFEGTSEGAKGHKDLVALYLTSFPNLKIPVEVQLGEGDVVISRWRASGTNTGPTLGVPPTGKSFEVIGFWMHRFEGNQIAEEWATWDTHGLLQQMGVSLP